MVHPSLFEPRTVDCFQWICTTVMEKERLRSMMCGDEIRISHGLSPILKRTLDTRYPSQASKMLFPEELPEVNQALLMDKRWIDSWFDTRIE